MGMTRNLVRWTAGRFGGSKAANRANDWMRKTGLGQILGAGGDLALAFGVGGLAGKGLQAVGKGLGTGSRLGNVAHSAGNFLAGTPATSTTGATHSIAGRTIDAVQKYAPKAFNYAIDPKNAAVTAAALNAGLQGYGAAQQQKISDEERRRQLLEARATADMLRPMFVKMFGNTGGM